MRQEKEQRHVARLRRCLSVGLWLIAAGAAAVVGIDPDGLAGS
jgi:hypothetical protein